MMAAMVDYMGQRIAILDGAGNAFSVSKLEPFVELAFTKFIKECNPLSVTDTRKLFAFGKGIVWPTTHGLIFLIAKPPQPDPLSRKYVREQFHDLPIRSRHLAQRLKYVVVDPAVVLEQFLKVFDHK